MEPVKHYTEYIKQAKQAEEEGDVETATVLYEKAIKQKPLLEQPYNRLMILYRKEKQYAKELKLIDKALEIFTEHYDKKKEVYKGSSQIARLSKALLKSVEGKKATGYSYPEPIPTWIKRKTLIEKKMKSA